MRSPHTGARTTGLLTGQTLTLFGREVGPVNRCFGGDGRIEGHWKTYPSRLKSEVSSASSAPGAPANPRSILTDELCRPIAFMLTGGQMADCRSAARPRRDSGWL